MFKLLVKQKPSLPPAAATKTEHAIHLKALIALEHYYKHGDSTPLTRVVRMFPNSNRKVAMLEWIRKFSILRWDREREVLVRENRPDHQDIEGAKSVPFWTFKIKQEQRRHVSGNTFDPDHFFDRVLEDIRDNIDRLPVSKLDHAIVELQKLSADKRIRVAIDNSIR